MPPKRKGTTSSPPTDGKLVKKRNQVNHDSIPSVTKDDNIEKANAGKNIDKEETNEKGFCTFTRKFVPPDPEEKKHDIKESLFPNLALNQYLKQKSKINLQGSSRWKIYLFPPPPKLTSFPKPPQSYFGLDLIDADKGRTHWTHKPDVWKNMFTAIFEFEKTGDADPISSVFDGVLSAPV